MWESSEKELRGGAGADEDDRSIVPVDNDRSADGLKTDGFFRRDNTWYVSSDIPSDIVVRVGGVSFHLHKYPLLCRSGRMSRIIYDSPREAELSEVELDDLPGGADAFELAAKFCYGIAVDLTAANISGLRCAAEFLEMTEDLEEGNLIFKTEAFLSYVVLSSWRDSIVVLKSCEGLSPWAENLQIVRRCSESIAWKACANPRGIRWAYTGRPTPSPAPPSSARGVSSPKWSNNGSKESSPSHAGHAVPPDWWFEDVCVLRIDHFVRVVTAIKVKGMRFNLIGAAIVHYAAKWLPGLGKDDAGGNNGVEDPWATVQGGGGMHMIIAGGASAAAAAGRDEASSAQPREQRMVIESLISIIPPQRDCVPCAFLLRLLRLANMLKAAPALVTELEKRVGMQLEQAALPDLLVPSYGRCETLYDVDLVQRLVEHFLVQEQTEASSPVREAPYDGAGGGAVPRQSGVSAKTRVARLIDSYLTEVSRDRNLSLTKFQVLAEALPESVRTCDDGLYRAVDSYLKAHPTLTEHERKRLCRVMDCQKLSMDACMHAAQNERLPIRVVVQVLFAEQVKISNALANSTLKETAAAGGALEASMQHHVAAMPSTRRQLLDGAPQSFQEGWTAAKKDINALKFELESMKAKYLELQNEMDALQKNMERAEPAAGGKGGAAGAGGKSGQAFSAWGSGWWKLGRLGKMANAEGAGGNAGAAAGAAGEVARKGMRRWRNSIS